MLLNLIVHQPQAMLQVISHTPYWVWGMLAGLVGLGASQLRDRSASLLRTQLMPLGMAAFSVAGLLSAFGGSASSGVQAVGLWLAAATATTAPTARPPQAPPTTDHDPRHREVKAAAPTPSPTPAPPIMPTAAVRAASTSNPEAAAPAPSATPTNP